MDRESPFRGFPMYNPADNDGRLFLPTTNLSELCEQFTTMTFDPYSPDMLHMRAISAASGTHQYHNNLVDPTPTTPFYNNNNNSLRYNGALLNYNPRRYNAATADVFNYNSHRYTRPQNYNSHRFNVSADLLNYNPHRYNGGGGDAFIYNNNSRRLNGGSGLNYFSPRRSNGLNYLPPDQEYEIPMNLNRNVVRSHTQRPNLGWTSLQEIRGNMVTVAKDQYGCRFLQNKLDEGNHEEVESIFSEVKDYVCDLIVHQFGNYLIQKLLEVCSQQQTTQLLILLVADDHRFAAICADMYGTRAVQKMLFHLITQEQRCRMVSALRRISVSLTKTLNGHHILMYCFKNYSPEENEQILNAVADNCLEIAFDKSGCCILQQCLEFARESRRRLIAEIISNAFELSQHPYGNYVVQYIIGLKISHITEEVVAGLSGNFVTLCMDKYGSNVVEKFLKETPEEDHNLIIPIIEEILYSPNFLRVLQDPFGNYVAQSSLRACKGPLFHAMIEMINRNSANLHSHPHGKRVLEKTNKALRSTTYM